MQCLERCLRATLELSRTGKQLQHFVSRPPRVVHPVQAPIQAPIVMMRQGCVLLLLVCCTHSVLAMDFGLGGHKHIAEPPQQPAADHLDSLTTAQGAPERTQPELADNQDADQQQDEEGAWDSYWDEAAAADSASSTFIAPAKVLESYDGDEDSSATAAPLTAVEFARSGPGGAINMQDMGGVLDSIIAEAARDMFGGPQRTLPEPVHALCRDMLTAPAMPRLLGLMDAGFELPSARPSFSLLPFRLPFPFPSMAELMQQQQPEGDGGIVVMSARSDPEDPVQWQEVVIESGDRGNNTPPAFVTDMLQAFEQQLAGSRLSRKLQPAEPQLESGELLKLVVSAGRRLQEVQALPAASAEQPSA